MATILLSPSQQSAGFLKHRLDLTDEYEPTVPASKRIKIEDAETTNKKSQEKPKVTRNACPFNDCEKLFVKPAHLKDHVKRVHLKEKDHQCSQCDKAYFRADHLRYHVKNKHLNQRDFVCDEPGCSKTFVDEYHLKEHSRHHEVAARNRVTCTDYPPCSRTFSKKARLERHIERDHFGVQSFKCTYVHPITQAPCSQTRKDFTSLQMHIQNQHRGLLNWCIYCTEPDALASFAAGGTIVDASGNPLGVGFGTYDELQAHIRIVHPPTCPWCDQVFRSEHLVQEHVDIHHSSKPISARQKNECAQCGKKFTRAQNLRQHVRSQHQKIKAFVCGTTDVSASAGLEEWTGSFACGDAFTTKQSLEKHIRRQHIDDRAAERAAKKIEKLAKRNAKGSSKVRGSSQTRDVLTGPMVCSVQDCSSCISSEQELREHLLSAHEWDEVEVDQELAAQRLELSALTGDRFWLGGIDDVEDSVSGQEDAKLLLQSPLRHSEKVDEAQPLSTIDPLLE